MRYDLAFFLCCCKSFLGSVTDEEGEEDFYSLLGLQSDATPDEIKRAYKRQSLQMHPDKLAQKGLRVTEEDQGRFTHMKEAYEVLSDPHKKETYDAIGKRGMKWLEEPFSLDPQELAHNFAKSSIFDRSKIFAIFVAIFVAVFVLPLFICLHVDGAFGNASWVAVLIPLWIWNVAIIIYHSRVIMMGPIQRPEHIPPEEWVDPLPMKKRYFSMFRFCLICIFELLAALKLDGTLQCFWSIVFIPLYIWEGTTLYKKFPLARMRIVTVEDLETALGKSFCEFSPAEKDLIGKRYSVVPSTASPEFEAAQKLKTRARHDMIKSGFRIAFVILLLLQLDGDMNWSWWFVFAPFWIMTGLFCYANYQAFSEVQQMAMEKDPTLFGLKKAGSGDLENPNYGAMGKDGEATPNEAAAAGWSQLTVEEQEELKAQVMASSSRLCSKCCSQGFLLVIVMLFVGKIQGAGYSSVWIISPFLFVAGIILCCLGCAIFGITEVRTDGVEFDVGDLSDSGTVESPLHTSSTAAAGATTAGTENPPMQYIPPPKTQTEEPQPSNIQAPSDEEKVKQPTTEEAPAATIPAEQDAVKPEEPLQKPTDLLDDVELGKPAPADDKLNSSLHELD